MNSLQDHGAKEAQKQLSFRVKRDGLTTVRVAVTRTAKRLKFAFTGTDAEVIKAEKILADWN